MVYSSDRTEIFVGFLEQIIRYKKRSDWVTKTKQSWQRVDAIFGLQQSKVFNDIHKAAKEEKVIRKFLRSDPLKPDDGMKLLFPFLVFEAKSGKAGIDWNPVLYKAALPTYMCLKTQERLRSKALEAGVSGWKSGPLLWLFTFKGRDWCMYAAYLKHNPNLTGLSSPYETVSRTHC